MGFMTLIVGPRIGMGEGPLMQATSRRWAQFLAALQRMYPFLQAAKSIYFDE